MAIEDDDKAAGAVQKAPRITLAMMEAEIAQVIYMNGLNCAYTADDPVKPDGTDSLGAMTLCFVVLKSGWVLVGKSAPIDPANFDVDLGKKIAYDDAMRQAWPLFGFYAKQREADGEPWPKLETFEGGIRQDPGGPVREAPDPVPDIPF